MSSRAKELKDLASSLLTLDAAALSKAPSELEGSVAAVPQTGARVEAAGEARASCFRRWNQQQRKSSDCVHALMLESSAAAKAATIVGAGSGGHSPRSTHQRRISTSMEPPCEALAAATQIVKEKQKQLLHRLDSIAAGERLLMQRRQREQRIKAPTTRSRITAPVMGPLQHPEELRQQKRRQLLQQLQAHICPQEQQNPLLEHYHHLQQPSPKQKCFYSSKRPRSSTPRRLHMKLQQHRHQPQEILEAQPHTHSDMMHEHEQKISAILKQQEDLLTEQSQHQWKQTQFNHQQPKQMGYGCGTFLTACADAVGFGLPNGAASGSNNISPVNDANIHRKILAPTPALKPQAAPHSLVFARRQQLQELAASKADSLLHFTATAEAAAVRCALIAQARDAFKNHVTINGWRLHRNVINTGASSRSLGIYTLRAAAAAWKGDKLHQAAEAALATEQELKKKAEELLPYKLCMIKISGAYGNPMALLKQLQSLKATKNELQKQTNEISRRIEEGQSAFLRFKQTAKQAEGAYLATMSKIRQELEEAEAAAESLEAAAETVDNKHREAAATLGLICQKTHCLFQKYASSRFASRCYFKGLEKVAVAARSAPAESPSTHRQQQQELQYLVAQQQLSRLRVFCEHVEAVFEVLQEDGRKSVALVDCRWQQVARGLEDMCGYGTLPEENTERHKQAKIARCASTKRLIGCVWIGSYRVFPLVEVMELTHKQWQQPQFAALLQQQLLQPVYNEQQLQELKQQGRAFAVAPVRGPAGINRGLGFVALRSLPEGFMVYEEAPLLSLQHTVNNGEATTAAAKQLLSLLLQHEHGLWEETERTEDESPGTDSEAEEENELDRREIVTRGTELLLLGLREKSEVYNHLVSASLVSRLLSVFEHCNTDLHQANPLNAFVSRCLLNPMSGGSEALRHLLAEKEAVLFLLFGSSDRNEGEDTDFRGPGEGVPSLHAIRNYYASKPLPELAPPLEDPMVPTEGDLPKSPQNTGRAFPPMKGTAFYCSMARINHCCNPNMRIEVGARGCLRLRLIRGVGCGEELCVSYLEGVRGMEREERRQRLKAFGFDCSCHHCTSGL
ncbi:hypothetical protein cyc_02159 [Cyclospora cayetanensis]|uniref:SET domain-containing protein n=1 Tax=Cyclospora cayetanensis TaxID=88456 RepID=A0A1D3D9T8_9EIME|nr:hypothetical protein cyc_02159 [Cyclospora cayetanensis]